MPVSGVQHGDAGSSITGSSSVDVDTQLTTYVDIDKLSMSGATVVADIDIRRYLLQEESMSRVQLALRVADLEAAVDFYSRLFDTAPAKRRPGYANFAIAEPPLKLVLLEGARRRAARRMDHLGVEVATAEEVTAAATRLAEAGLETRVEDNTTCCYAVQDKVWVTGPGGEPWEVYTVAGGRPARPGGADRPGAVRGRRRRHVLPAGSDTDARLGASCC